MHPTSKKPAKEVTKQVEKQPLQNIEMSGYEMNFDENLRPTYPLYTEYDESVVRFSVVMVCFVVDLFVN